MSRSEDHETQSPISSGSVDVQHQIESLTGFVKTLRQDFEAEKAELRDTIEELQTENQRLRAEIKQTQQAVAEVRDATDLLRFIEEQQQPAGEQSKAALVLSLKRKAERRQKRHGKRPVAKIDREEAEHILAHPDVERTTIYKWMKRAADMIDGDVLVYESGELKVNLQAGAVPNELVSDAAEATE